MRLFRCPWIILIPYIKYEGISWWLVVFGILKERVSIKRPTTILLILVKREISAGDRSNWAKFCNCAKFCTGSNPAAAYFPDVDTGHKCFSSTLNFSIRKGQALKPWSLCFDFWYFAIIFLMAPRPPDHLNHLNHLNHPDNPDHPGHLNHNDPNHPDHDQKI